MHFMLSEEHVYFEYQAVSYDMSQPRLRTLGPHGKTKLDSPVWINTMLVVIEGPQ